MAKADIKINVGADTGVSTDILKQDLKNIAKILNKQKVPQITVSLNVAATQANLQKQLQQIVKGIKLNVSVNPTIKSGGNSSSSSGNINAKTPVINSKTSSELAIIEQKVKQAELAFQKLENAPIKVANSVTHLQSKLTSLQNAKTPEQQKIAFDKLNNSLKVTNATMQTLNKGQSFVKKNIDDVKKLDRDMQTLLRSTQNYYKANKNIVGSKYDTGINNVMDKLALGAGKKGSYNNIKDARLEVGKLQAEIRNAGFEGKKMWQQIGGAYMKFGSWAMVTGSLGLLINGFRDMITVVKELDQSFVNLRMVTGSSVQETTALMNSYNKMGQKLGASTQEVAIAGNEFLRQGMSIADTNKLIEASLVLSKVGMLDSASSTAFLTSSMKGYQVSVQDTLKIVDKLSSVDMVSATSAGGLAEAMAKTANGARLAGIEMDKLLGMLAATAEVTQADPSQVGTAYKGIFARMSNIKLGKIEDEDGENISEYLSDAEEALDRVDIKLRKNATEFNNFGDVFDQVGNKWKQLSQVDQNLIATTFAGKMCARAA